MQKNVINKILFSVFFISGAVGLIYQVLWARIFALVFGNTIFASSTVLAAFMGGLGLGSYLIGSYITKNINRSGLKLYGLMELIVGIFGLSMPFIKNLTEMLYTEVFRVWNPSFTILTAFRFLLSFIVLVIPCVFMGATLPVLSKYISDNGQDQKLVIGKLYGLNTLGAFLGCLMTGFYFIGRVGIIKTSFIAAALNFTVAIFCFGMNLKQKSYKNQTNQMKSNKRDIVSHQIEEGRYGKILLVLFAFSGFAALALEVAWTRVMVWILSMDSYAFAAMLSVILAGMGLGSLISILVAKKIKQDKRFLIILEFLIGVFVLVSVDMIQNSVRIKSGLENLLNNWGSIKFIYHIISPITLSQLLLSACILLIPSILMGIAFPVFTSLYVRLYGNVGKGVGNIYAANTFGAILGSLAMGFVLMPVFGLLPSIGIMSGIYFLSACMLFFVFSSEKLKRKLLKLTSIAAIAILLFIATDFNSINFLKTTLSNGNAEQAEKLLYFKENATGDVLVKESKTYGHEMLIDGVQVASDGDFDLHSHIYPAHLMNLLKKDPKDILVVAFGCGGTSGSILKYNDMDKLDVVEISNGVIDPAKEFFTSMNSNVFSNKKLNLIIQDGKNFVHMTNKSYDIIYSGPIHPQSNQGSAGLYTKDYFLDCKARLKSDGFQCLWLPMHMSSPEDFKIIVKTFMEVYPYVSMWDLPETNTSIAHPHLIGSMKPIYPDYQVISEKLKRPEIISDIKRLNETSFTKPYEFISQLMMGEDALKKFVGNVSSDNTDDLPIVEFYKRPNDYLVSTAASKAMLLLDTSKYMENPYKYVQNVPENEKSELKKQIDRLYEGNKDLIMGHYFLTAKQIISSNVDKSISDYYKKAYELIPESSYLKEYFNR